MLRTSCRQHNFCFQHPCLRSACFDGSFLHFQRFSSSPNVSLCNSVEIFPNPQVHVLDAFPADKYQVLAAVARNDGLHESSKILTHEGKNILDEENFRSSDFWEGYKLYCFARYSHCRRSRGRFIASKMGRVVSLIQKDQHVRWGSIFDGRVRQVLAMMEEYAEICHGQDWRNLRALMEEFDDVKKLSASENGSLLLQLIEDDDNGTERLHRQSHAVQVQCTNIFDELKGRLKRVGSNLNSLMESSGASSKGYKNDRGKRRRPERTVPTNVEKR